MDYDMVSSMGVEELKKYLRLRGLRVTGRKQELVARVFATTTTTTTINLFQVDKSKICMYIKKTLKNSYTQHMRYANQSQLL